MLKEIEALKKDLETLNKDRIKAEGALEQAMLALNEMGFRTLPEAEAKLKKLELTYKQAEKEAADLMLNLREKYADFIE